MAAFGQLEKAGRGILSNLELNSLNSFYPSDVN